MDTINGRHSQLSRQQDNMKSYQSVNHSHHTEVEDRRNSISHADNILHNGSIVQDSLKNMEIDEEGHSLRFNQGVNHKKVGRRGLKTDKGKYEVPPTTAE